jgi:hypothetical protein
VRRTAVSVAAAFLALSYGIGAPVCGILEYRSQLFSHRFDLRPELVYLVFVVQFASAIAVLAPRLASWAAAALTVTTLGAVASHVRIGSPLTAMPALLYTAVQIWYGLASRARERASQ